MTNINYNNTPNFVGRDVPIEEIAKATGKSATYLREGLKRGVFSFGHAYLKPGGHNYSFFCPDKKVWEELGYFKDITKDAN